MIVAIHQPNYLPWLGYFSKIVQSDVFVFLDDCQYSKNSFINRVQVLNGDKRHWLTIPVHANLTTKINEVRPANPDWLGSHRSTLKNFYGAVENVYENLPTSDLAAINSQIIKNILNLLGISRKIVRSSDIDTGNATGDLRLALIVKELGDTYLSGQGGRKYQSEKTFEDHGVALQYTTFKHPTYKQSGAFEPGLSIIDAASRLGWKKTRQLID